MQEGPEKIRVYGKPVCTTASAENFNGVLKRNIVVDGNFFQFTHDLRGEDVLKSTEFKEFMAGKLKEFL